MPRLPAAALLALLLPSLAAAQPLLSGEPKAPPADDVDAKVRREVEKAKAELRDEVRAELQAQQSAKDFLEGPAQEKTKLQFLQLEGAFRVRGALYNDLTLRRSADPGGFFLFPPQPDATGLSQNRGGTQTTGNLRLRLEPTLNVSEQVRVLGQLDLLDGVVLGSSVGSTGQTAPLAGSDGVDRNLRVKRAWGEVQTPVGLLSFGRMPAHWGLGILANAGSGLDADAGDNVDRVQIAVRVPNLPLPLVVVPFYDIQNSGLVSQNLGATGQPMSLTNADAGYATGLKLLKADTQEEVSRAFARGEGTWSLGLLYDYQARDYSLGPPATGVPGSPGPGVTVTETHLRHSAHTLDLWAGYRTQRARVEGELTFVYGSTGGVNLRQYGAVIQSDWRPRDGKWLLGLEWGLASGDPSPGMGNQPDRGLPGAGWIDGYQGADGSIRNFRFNAAYRVDEVLWRELLGNVTGAWYLKPTVRFDVLPGFSLKTAFVYSQALDAASTPSSIHRALGLEWDNGLHYASDDGFHLWIDWGWLFSLDGLGYSPALPRGIADHALVNAHALRTGLAIKF